MKKTLAAVLGLALMTNVAIASNPSIGTSGVIAPGSDLDITLDQFKSGSTSYLTNENFSISSKKITKGANLIKEIKINDDDEVVRIVLNQDVELSQPKNDNLVIETLSIKAKKTSGDVSRGEILTIKDISEKIGHTVTDVNLTSSGITALSDGMNKIAKDSSVPYGDVSYSVGEMMLEGRAYGGDKIFIKGSQKANTSVLKAYPEADMRFVSMETNGLPTSFNVLLAAEEDEFIYKINSDGKLAASGLKWSDDDYAWVGKVRSTTNYVISDTRLTISSVEEEVEGSTEATNPDTGANDVVGVAAALAVVSLVAAGAVSLKK